MVILLVRWLKISSYCWLRKKGFCSLIHNFKYFVKSTSTQNDNIIPGFDTARRMHPQWTLSIKSPRMINCLIVSDAPTASFNLRPRDIGDNASVININELWYNQHRSILHMQPDGYTTLVSVNHHSITKSISSFYSITYVTMSLGEGAQKRMCTKVHCSKKLHVNR